MSRMSIAAHSVRSVKGARRESNQDRYLVDAELGFALLADGVAGRPSGGRAAQLAVEAAALQLRLVLTGDNCTDLPTARRLVTDAFLFADIMVCRAAEQDIALAHMATTLLGGVFLDHHVIIGNVGNSRAYRMRGTKLEQLTQDHVHQPDGLARLSDEEVALVRSLVQPLTRSLGQGEARPDLCVEALHPADLYLLCSNGLSDVLGEDGIGEVLTRTACVEDLCNSLVQLAVTAGAEDDVTALIVQPSWKH